MKTKTHPKTTRSGDYMYQGLIKGLSRAGKNYADDQIKKFESLGVAIPWGIIRAEASKR